MPARPTPSPRTASPSTPVWTPIEPSLFNSNGGAAVASAERPRRQLDHPAIGHLSRLRLRRLVHLKRAGGAEVGGAGSSYTIPGRDHPLRPLEVVLCSGTPHRSVLHATHLDPAVPCYSLAPPPATSPPWPMTRGPGSWCSSAASTSSGSFLNDTWTWNGTTWTQQFPTTSPPARDAASMAYDSGTGQLVLFGGDDSSGGFLNDTWTWNGANWTQQFPTTSPPARADASMAYDSGTGQLVLFGGDSSDGFLNDTWTWNGTTWTQQFPATSPYSLRPLHLAPWPMTRGPGNWCSSATPSVANTSSHLDLERHHLDTVVLIGGTSPQPVRRLHGL